MLIMVEAFRPPRQEFQRHREGELPESEMFGLLSVVNSENKLLEVIVMREGIRYSKLFLYKEIMSHQAEDRRWKMHVGLPFAHCEKSFSPIGLVDAQALSADGSVREYQITRFGLETVPFAGLLLKWSYEHPEHSLYDMLGTTNSSSIKDEQTLEKKRAQETRYRIYKFLLEASANPSNRIIGLIDVANGINEDFRMVSSHFKSLSKSGVISYEASARGKSYSYFRRKETVPDQEPTQYRTGKILLSRVYDLLTYSLQEKPDEYLSGEEMTNLLTDKYPEYKDVNRKSLSMRIASILPNFEKQGYSEREKFHRGFKSEVFLSDRQRELIMSFITAIDNFKNGDKEAIREGREFAQIVVNDPNLFSDLMLKAKEASPAANKTSREDMEGWIISILYEHSNSTKTEIQQILEEDYDKMITVYALRDPLASLVKGGKIIPEKTKSGNVYRVAEPDVQADLPQN